MKITKSVLKQLIKEELKHIEEVSGVTPEMAAKPEYKLGALAQGVIMGCDKIKKLASAQETPDKIKMELIIKTAQELQKLAEEILHKTR